MIPIYEFVEEIPVVIHSQSESLKLLLYQAHQTLHWI